MNKKEEEEKTYFLVSVKSSLKLGTYKPMSYSGGNYSGPHLGTRTQDAKNLNPMAYGT